jgi:hypothetical protein
MKKNIISGLLGALVSILIFCLAYLLLNQSQIDKFLPRTKMEGLIYFLVIIIAPIFTIAIHELGHMITGITLGQKFKLFIVAFLGIVEDKGKIKLFLNKNLAYFGGIVVVVPKSVDKINHRIFAKTLIAGPLTSLVYGIVCLLIFIEFDTMFNSFFGLSSLTSLGLFLATTIPEKSGIMYTDRKRYQRLNKDGVTRDAEIALYQVITQSIIENSFKNIELSKTYIIEKDEEVEMKFWAEYIRYLYYKDNHNSTVAEATKNRLLNYKQLIPNTVWKSLQLD